MRFFCNFTWNSEHFRKFFKRSGYNIICIGIPKTIEVSSDEIRQALKDPINAIVEAVKRCLEQTPPELAADILERGIILAGGGSLLLGIDQIIREKTNVPVNVSEDPLLSVVKGTGMVLENLKKYEAVLL